LNKYYYHIFININRKIIFFNRLIINNILKFFFKESYNNTYRLIDKNIFEIIGPFGIVYNIKVIIHKVNLLQTGLLYHYIGIILLFILYSIYFII